MMHKIFLSKNIQLLLKIHPLGLVLLSLLLTSTASLSQAQENIHMDAFLQEAIYQGLIRDAFPVALAEKITESEQRFFVVKCPICMPVERGFKQYIRAGKITGKRSKTPKIILMGLKSEDRNIKLNAFAALTKQYTKRHLKKLKLKKTAKEALQEALLDARKQGMERKSDSFGTFCPSCDGVCDMPKK